MAATVFNQAQLELLEYDAMGEKPGSIGRIEASYL